jgi:septal ring factor EnvC (AmiA/AmiB activator)
MNHHLALSLLLSTTLCLCFSLRVEADASSEYRASVERIATQIKKLSGNLNTSKKKLKTARDELLESEQKINLLAKKMQQTKDKLEHTVKTLEFQKSLIEGAQQQQSNNRDALKALIVSRYTNGQDNYLKLLLNQQNPYAVGRLANYSEYFSAAMRLRINQVQEELLRISDLRKQQEELLAQLSKQQMQQRQQQENWGLAQKKRSRVVTKLDKEVSQSSQKLAALKEDRARLNTLLKELAKQAAELKRAEQKKREQEAKAAQQRNQPVPVQHYPVRGGFIEQKGRLRYPSTGKRIRNYGSRVAASGMVSDGVFFAAKQSTPVTAVFRGRVLFADFLKGYGLLLIIDHGDEHISLYGHNEVIYKSVGDQVDTNELISRSGVTGGLKSSGLYFEIRKNASPVDPAKWCQ